MCAATATAVAVAATAAATVASTAYKMSQGGAKGTQAQSVLEKKGIVPAGPAERQFQQGTNQLLDETRGVVENAVGQGQQIDPQVYQWLGMNPIYEDNTAQLQDFSGKVNAAQQQVDTLQNNIDTLNAIPKGKRTPGQKKQLRQMMKEYPKLQQQMSDLSAQRSKMETMPKRITGFNKMDPNTIPKESPFSSQNPLNQAQAAEAGRLNDYLSGKLDVDPTLKHQWDSQEAALRAKLSERLGPDYENTSVGQMALQNFGRSKSESYSTWNQSMVQKYNDLAFGGAANLQSLLAGQIHLAYAPSEEARSRGVDLQNSANARIAQESALQRERGIKTDISGLTTTKTPVSTTDITAAGKTAVSGLGALSQLLKDYNAGKDTGTTPAGEEPVSGTATDLTVLSNAGDQSAPDASAGI